jgi:hypothetical protein
MTLDGPDVNRMVPHATGVVPARYAFVELVQRPQRRLGSEGEPPRSPRVDQSMAGLTSSASPSGLASAA